MALKPGFRASLVMDDDQQSLGNSPGDDGRGQLHVKAFAGGILNGIAYDAGTVAYPDTITEVYSLLKGGLSGTLVATVTLVYTNATKKLLSSFDAVFPP